MKLPLSLMSAFMHRRLPGFYDAGYTGPTISPVDLVQYGPSKRDQMLQGICFCLPRGNVTSFLLNTFLLVFVQCPTSEDKLRVNSRAYLNMFAFKRSKCGSVV